MRSNWEIAVTSVLLTEHRETRVWDVRLVGRMNTWLGGTRSVIDTSYIEPFVRRHMNQIM